MCPTQADLRGELLLDITYITVYTAGGGGGGVTTGTETPRRNESFWFSYTLYFEFSLYKAPGAHGTRTAVLQVCLHQQVQIHKLFTIETCFMRRP